MKNYFGFSLTGIKLLPVWLAFYLLFLVPYVILSIKMGDIQQEVAPGELFSAMRLYYGILAVLIVIQFIFMFYIYKLMIKNTQYNNQTLEFNGTLLRYLGVVFLGGFLSIITLGIYYSWFVKKLLGFYVDNSTMENESFKFKGKGGKLFLIFLLALFIPIILLVVLFATVGKSCFDPGICASALGETGVMTFGIVAISEIVMLFIMVPFIYLYYKWIVNINYKNYNVRFDTGFWNSCGKIALELFLSIITIGIYSPAAGIKIYKYFADRTVAQSAETKRSFGFEANNWSDFLYIWGQTLLTIITIGIYAPWCICNVNKRILSRTYLE